MNKSLLASLNEQQRLLIAETEPKALADLDEDGALALHDRIRRARNKHVGLYRRGASAKVSAKGGRGKAAPTNTKAALQAEAFEEALARVSRRLGVLAAASAAELKAERLEAAAAVKSAGPGTEKPSPRGKASAATTSRKRTATKTPATKKDVASTRSTGARRQAKRDSR